MSSKRFGALTRVALSLSLAGAAFGASAQTPPPAGTAMYFQFAEDFLSTQYGLSAPAGVSKYFHFDVPAGATHVRVETHAPAGRSNVAFTVREGTTDYPMRCLNGETDKPVSTCGFEPVPGRYYIEVAGSQAWDDIALIVSVLPESKPVAAVQDQPYQLGKRASFSTETYDTPHCLESRRAQAPSQFTSQPIVPGAPLPAATCMPMGNPQQWRFESHGGDFLVRNLYSNGCLVSTSNAIGASVLDGNCDAGSAANMWRLSAPAGATHYTMIRNIGSGLCLDFVDGAAAQVECREGTPQGPAFDLRNSNKRWKPQGDHGGAISVVLGGLCATREVDSAVLGDCRNVDASGLFFVESETSGPWSGAFHAMSVIDGRCLAQYDENDGHRYAVFNECDSQNPSHSWTLVASGETAWEFRNMATGECLNAQGGSGAPGTKLITSTCTPAADNARWHWAMH